MIKRLLTIVAMSGCLFCANAEKQYMTVEQLDGTKYSFLLDENPVITYKGDNLVVNDNAKTSYQIESIKNYHFTEDDQSGVKNQVANMLSIVSLDESRLQVKNAQASDKVALVNVNGMIVFSASTDSEGTAIVTLPEQKGVYVLTVGAKSLKVIRK